MAQKSIDVDLDFGQKIFRRLGNYCRVHGRPFMIVTTICILKLDIPQMTPDLTRTVAMFCISWKPAAKCGRQLTSQQTRTAADVEPEETRVPA